MVPRAGDEEVSLGEVKLPADWKFLHGKTVFRGNCTQDMWVIPSLKVSARPDHAFNFTHSMHSISKYSML